MINLIIYALAIIAVSMLVYKEDKKSEYIERESDATIEVVAGKYILKEK